MILNDEIQGYHYGNRLVHSREEIPKGIGLKEIQASNIQVYPNPIQRGETLSITLENENDLGQIEILSLNGQVLSQINRSEIANSGKQINILPPAHPGLYLVQIKNQNGEVLKMQKIQVL